MKKDYPIFFIGVYQFFFWSIVLLKNITLSLFLIFCLIWQIFYYRAPKNYIIFVKNIYLLKNIVFNMLYSLLSNHNKHIIHKDVDK